MFLPAKDRPPCEHDDLIGKVDRLQGQVTTIKELRKQLAAAQQPGKRQAAPFSKGERVSKPRRPGRKHGELQLPKAAGGGRTD